MRHAVLLLLLCACSSLSSAQRDELADHQRYAKLYFEGGNLGQAMGQIEKGLALEPDNYQLNTLKGRILLQTSASSQGTDHRRLDEATALLASVYDQRSANRHEQYLLFDYARALQKQGRRHLGEALRLRGEATRNPAQKDLGNKAAAEQTAADEQLAEATALLGVLVERGELKLLTRYHLLLIAQDRHDDVAFLDHAGKYLKQMEDEQATLQRVIERTKEVTHEQEVARNLRTLKAQEMEVRALLAEHHYRVAEQHLALQQTDKAKEEFALTLAQLDKVLSLDPSRSTDYYNRGRVLQALDRHQDAKADFRKFLATTTLPASSEKTTFATMALGR